MMDTETFCDKKRENNAGSIGYIISEKRCKFSDLHPLIPLQKGVKKGRFGKTRPAIGEFSTLSTDFSTGGEKLRNM